MRVQRGHESHIKPVSNEIIKAVLIIYFTAQGYSFKIKEHVKPLHFLTFLIFSAITVFSVRAGFPYMAFPIVFVFVIIPLLDFVLGEQKKNPQQNEELAWKSVTFWAPAVYLYVITHFLILYLSLRSTTQISWAEILLLGFVVGLYTGGLGITVAHELCHKTSRVHRFFADLLLATVGYSHFAVEHVRGHHFNVATPIDPASAQLNESVYQFLPRTLWGSLTHAFSIDRAAVLKGMASTLVLGALIYFFFDLKGLLFFVVQAVVAVLLLELVNYVEHYGLSRERLQNGRYEKVRVEHSWNSSHLFSSLLLFNLQRHSDHHAAAFLPYTVLKHQENAPQLPSGYPGMILLALFPKYWFRLMNKLLVQFQQVKGK